MKKIIVFFCSLTFSLFVIFNSIFFLGIRILLIKLFVSEDKMEMKIDNALIKWGEFVMFCLKHIVNINYNIIDFDKLDKDKNYLIVCKHESVWEAFIMHTIMKNTPAFVLKNEMLYVPFFGWALSNGTHIGIDRKKGLTSLKKIVRLSKYYSKKNKNIIIFPQGTRVPYNSDVKDYPYKIGFVVLAKQLGVDLVPVALNSGKLWRKKQFMKYPGTITMKFLEPIKYEDIKKMKNHEVLNKVEDIIESECKKLNNYN